MEIEENKWKEKEKDKQDYKEDYKEVFQAQKWFLENKFNSSTDRGQIQFLKDFKNFLYRNVHERFSKIRTQTSETEIRNICKYIIAFVLPVLRNKILFLNTKRTNGSILSNEMNTLMEFLDLEDDFMALASFRSLTHFAIYMETQDDEQDKVWKYTMDNTMGSIFYYANSMILDHKFSNLIKQTPTGYGKSKSDCGIISFILGYDMNASVMKIVGNPTVLQTLFNRLILMIQSKKYGKVFPEIGKYNGSDEMFSLLQKSEGKFLLKDSKKGMSFAIFNKETPIDGERYNYQFYDDITKSKDIDNITEHEKDNKNYINQWRKRQDNEYTTLRFFTGTSYHSQDFLSNRIKELSNGENLILDIGGKGNTFKWSKYVRLSNDKKTVFIRIPKLDDLEKGEDKCFCTFPERFSKKVALEQLHSSDRSLVRSFYAMEQQTPLPPESLSFDWIFLKTYDKLPDEILRNECETWAIIDPNRKGNDNYACLIFKSIRRNSNINRNNVNDDGDDDEKYWYLVDCYYEKKTAKKALPEICERLAFHKVDIVSFEENTTDIDLMTQFLTENMKKNLWENFTLDSFWSDKRKVDKIFNYQDDIKEKIIFPEQRIYRYDSPMGRAMCDITTYSISSTNNNNGNFGNYKKNDDSIDCCAMLCERLSENRRENKIDAIDIRSIW